VADSCTICSSRSRQPVWKLLDTPSYQINTPCIKKSFVCMSIRVSVITVHISVWMLKLEGRHQEVLLRDIGHKIFFYSVWYWIFYTTLFKEYEKRHVWNKKPGKIQESKMQSVRAGLIYINVWMTCGNVSFWVNDGTPRFSRFEVSNIWRNTCNEHIIQWW
jgi:hypothetical protein